MFLFYLHLIIFMCLQVGGWLGSTASPSTTEHLVRMFYSDDQITIITRVYILKAIHVVFV